MSEVKANLPDLGQQLQNESGALVDEYLTVQSRSIERDNNSSGLAPVYRTTVVYDTRPAATTNSRTTNSTALGVSLNIGTISQRVYQDIHGQKIGDAILYDGRSVNYINPLLDAEGKVIENPSAELGADVQIPTVELQVSLPRYVDFTTARLYNIINTVGRVNNANITLQNNPQLGSSPISFSKGELLCVGVDGNWLDTSIGTSTASTTFDITVVFIAGLADVRNGNLPLVNWDGTSASGRLVNGKLPIEYGYWTQWRLKDVNLADGAHVEPQELVAARIYKTANFAAIFSEVFQ